MRNAMHKSAPAEFSVALGKTSSDDHTPRSTEPRWFLRCVGTDLMQRSVFAKEPDQLALLVRIEAHLLAMIRDIKVSGTRLADLSVVDMFHQRFLLGGETPQHGLWFRSAPPTQRRWPEH